jgi:peptidoglycan/LPS O-acetylase OafA/YrhL
MLVAAVAWGTGDPQGFGRVIVAVGIVVAAFLLIYAVALEEGEDEDDLDQRISDWLWSLFH